jgi:asparagine synthase (glutamine-hydrolysing)
MCGITGWIDWNQDLTRERATLEAMTEKLTARGPDAAGYWVAPEAALGHRRLIVIDPEGGKQPMVRSVGERRYILVYNGELYNTAEIREELQARGHIFHSYSDTEAVLLAFIEWGPECLNRFNGIFALGIWDENRRQLFLARDRMGVKPLFYYHSGGFFLFGSEIKALLSHTNVKPKIDKEGLAEIFGLGPARTPGNGIVRGIAELRPGCFLIYNQNELQINQYWKLRSEPHPDDFETTVAKVRELVTDAIRRQLVSDVPVCAFLSGGLDSSIISAVASCVYRKENRRSLRTFSIEYQENETYFRADEFQPDPDRLWAERVANYIQSFHREVIINISQLVEALKPAMRARDLPGMADVDASLLLFCREIKREATVGLSGECADEVFGGYPWFRRPESVSSGTFPWSLSLNMRNRILQPWLQEKLQIDRYVEQCYRRSLSEMSRLPQETPEEVRRRELFHLNLQWFMAVLLERKDRMSMATGLEVRVPFCDHRIVEYVWNIPWNFKNWQGREKGLLREAFRHLLPSNVVERKKSPYPKTHHPAYLLAVKQRFAEIIRERGPLVSLIDSARVAELLDAERISPPWFGQLMTGPQLLAFLIQINDWLAEYQIEIDI